VHGPHDRTQRAQKLSAKNWGNPLEGEMPQDQDFQKNISKNGESIILHVFCVQIDNHVTVQ